MKTFKEFLESKKHPKHNKLVSDIGGEPVQIPGDTKKPKKGKLKLVFDIEGDVETIRGMKKK